MRRVAVLVHPSRPVDAALATVRVWATEHDLEVVQVDPLGTQPSVAPLGEVGESDVVVALGGDGTVLRALHATAKTGGTPVIGVAEGSLGALSAVSPGDLRVALDAYAQGDWTPRRLPALTTTADDMTERALNDIVLVRRGATQLIVEVYIDGELYVRLAGDGLVVATELGSSAYSMAAGGPLLVLGTDAFVCTPLAMHGGCAPPLLVPADRVVTLEADPGYGGLQLELDGHEVETKMTRFQISRKAGYATLVELGKTETNLPGLRRRGLIADSPRVLARDRRR